MAFRFVATLNSAVVIAVLLAASSTHAAFDIGFGDDSDLTHFVSVRLVQGVDVGERRKLRFRSVSS